MSKDKVKSIDDLFQTDKSIEVDEGVVLDYGDFRVRIARAGGANVKFNKVLSARLKPFKRQLETDTMDEKVAAKVMAEVYADTVVLGMDIKVADGKYESGILRRGGKRVEYSRENVVAVFTDLPEFFRAVQADANSVSLFRAEVVEEEIKNSSPA